MKRPCRVAAISLAVVVAVGLITASFMVAQRGGLDLDEDDQPVATQVNIAQEQGRTVLVLTGEEQQRQGISVTPIEATAAQSQTQALAVLLPVEQLATARTDYLNAETKAQQSRMQMEVARSEYERVNSLYEQNQNMSLKAKQEAESNYHSQQLAAGAAAEQVRLTLDSVQQQWGPEVAKWIGNDGPRLSSLLAQQEFLAQVAFPAGYTSTPPRRLTVEIPGGHVEGRFLSASPKVISQVQGPTYLYLLPARPGMAAGMNLTAPLKEGVAMRGAFIPNSAIVWWDGKAWAYEEVKPGRFTRLEVATSTPLNSGYLVTGGFKAGTRLVTAGAQLLLSEEFRSQAKQEG